MRQIGPEPLHPSERVADRRRQGRLAGDAAELDGEQGLQIIEDRFSLGLADLSPDIRRRAPDLVLDCIESGDPLDRHLGDGRALGLVHVDELAPDMRHAGDLGDAARPVQPLEAGIAVCMHPAGEVLEMANGPTALAIGRKPIECRRRGGACPRPFVSDIGPNPGSLGFTGAGHLHPDRRVVGENGLAAQHVPANRFGERFQQSRRSPDPISQRRALQIDPIALGDLGLTIERKVVGVFADQHMRQQSRPTPAALDRSRRQGRLADLLTASASHARPNDPVHDKAAGDVLQFFRHVLACGSAPHRDPAECRFSKTLQRRSARRPHADQHIRRSKSLVGNIRGQDWEPNRVNP